MSSGCSIGPRDSGGYVPMTDLSIRCLHSSTTSWEFQQRGGIVEDVMDGRGTGGGVAAVVIDRKGEELMGGPRRWSGYECGEYRGGEEVTSRVDGRSFIERWGT